MAQCHRGGFGPRTLAAVVAFLVSGAVEPCAAQSVEQPTRTWLAVGLAASGARDLETDAGMTVQLTLQRGPHQFALRTLFAGDFDSFPSGSDDSISELGVTYGRRSSTPFGFVSVATGLALVRVAGLPRDDAGGFSPSDDGSRRTVGVPLVAEAGLQSRLVGVGVQLFGGLNSLSPYAGAALLLHLGWMP